MSAIALAQSDRSLARRSSLALRVARAFAPPISSRHRARQATARFIAKAAAAQHYRSRPLDAQLSAEMYQRFLAGLDPGRDSNT